MQQVDAQLLADVCRLINAANLDWLKGMIFAYEQAVDLHNRHCAGHEIYRIESEARLRLYVVRQQGEAIKRITLELMERAEQATQKGECA